MNYSGKCYFVYKKKAQLFDEAKAANGQLSFSAADTEAANRTLAADNYYAGMLYEKRGIIVLITRGSDADVICLIHRNNSDYVQTVNAIKETIGLEFSIQDSKLISYARSVAEKLRIGVELNITAPQSEEDFVICPSCGMKNNKNAAMPFCMDCGEPL